METIIAMKKDDGNSNMECTKSPNKTRKNNSRRQKHRYWYKSTIRNQENGPWNEDL